MVVLAQVCVAVADRACSRRLYDRLLPYAGRVVVVAQAHACLGAVAYYLGLLAALDERWDEAAAHLDDALHAAEAVGGALLVAYAQCALASVLRVSAPGSPRTAALHAAAGAAAQRLGTARLAAQVEALHAPDRDAMTPAAQSIGAAMPAVFRKDAQYWTVAFDGAESRLKHSRGLAYLAELLRHPDREFHTLDLGTRHRDETDTQAPGDDAGAMLDPAAKAAYRERLEQMRAEVEDATALNDLGRAERAREEMEVLMQQLAGAVGLGNRDRKIHSNAERSRVAVTKAVTLALRTIGEANPSLRRYLAGTIKTGQFCSYTPDPRFPVTWRLE
jgi:non-specific serine/threonine protein kinase